MSNPKKSDATILLRDELKVVLGLATRPLSSTEIGSTPQVASLGIEQNRVAMELSTLYHLKKENQPFPIKRIRSASAGRTMYEYYNPKVVKLAPYTPPAPAWAGGKEDPVKEPAPVNAVKPAEFQFDPVEFDAPGPVVDPAPPVPVKQVDVPVTVPPGVKCITLTVGGVSIKIELQ